MITTAVQYASQIVEVEGAPSTEQTTGDDFRATFTASVSDTAARQTSLSIGEKTSGDAAVSDGLSSVKASLTALSAKSVSLAQSGFQSLLRLKSAGVNEDVTELATGTASTSNVKNGSDLALKNAATTGPVIDDPIAGDDLRSAVLTQVANGSPVEPVDPGAEKLPARAAVTRSATFTDVLKGEELSKPTDRLAVSARKDGVSASNNEIVHTATPATVPETAVVDTAPASVTVPVIPLAQLPTTRVSSDDGASLAQQGSKPAVLTPVIRASGDVKTASVNVTSGSQDFRGANHFGSTGNFSLAATGLDEVASLKQGSLTLTSAAPGVARTGGSSGVANRAAIAGKVAGSVSKSHQADIGRSITATGPAGSALALQPGATDTQSLSSAKETQPKTNAFSTGPQTGLQLAEVAQRRSTSIVQPQAAAQTIRSNDFGAVSEPVARAGDSDGPNLSTANSAGKTLAGGEAASTLAGAKIPQQLDGVRDAAPAIGLVPSAASKAVAAATKDEKAKRAEDGDEDTATRSATAQTALGNISDGVTNSSVAVAGGGAARVVAVADPATSVAQGSTHNSAPSGHAAGIETTSAAPVRAAGSLSAGQVAESSSAAVQTSESHRTLLATPTSLEVGVQSGTQGWLRIRAEVGDQGAVNASLTTASSGGRELLHSQMPALNAFLHSEQMAVTTTVVDRGSPLAGGQASVVSGGLGGQDGSANSNGLLSQGGGAQADGGQREMARGAMSVNEMGANYDSRGSVTDGAGLSTESLGASGESGRWLNVRV